MVFELELIKWLQSFRSDLWDFFFQMWTIFGEELVIVGLMGFVYWCYDKKVGEALGITVFVSLVVNSIIKVIVQRPRPFLVDEAITNIRPQTAGGFSFPSGHTQGAATVFGGLAIWIRKRLFSIIVGVIIVMVALSRMYLGVHYLSDVVVGALLALGISYAFYWLLNKLENRTRLYIYLLFGAGIIFLVLCFYFIMTVEATATLTNAQNLYNTLEGVAKMMGAIFGFTIGVLFEHRKVAFSNHRVLWKNLIRFALGVGIVMGVRLGLKFVFGLIVDPEGLAEGELGLATLVVLFDFIRYGAMVLIGIGIYPLAFKRFNF
ncbi:MAG: phosphatase PAP2 family protein [Candidatus Izemoplasmatales bacterium]|nr:phosphatase PAP2 family protein [Candidatus Izemoplasmatales bacterium]